MAVPKRKTSRTNRDKRRTHHGIKVLNIVECPRCHSKKIAHHVCQSCGYYKNSEMIPQKKEAKGKEKEKAAPRSQEKEAEKSKK